MISADNLRRPEKRSTSRGQGLREKPKRVENETSRDKEKLEQARKIVVKWDEKVKVLDTAAKPMVFISQYLR